MFVDNAVPLGIYTSGDKGKEGFLPLRNASGLWQVWKLPDATFMIQPLDKEREPCGGSVMISGEVFYNAMTPLPPQGAAGNGEQAGSRLHSNSPDLLVHWYELALAESPSRAALYPASEYSLDPNDEMFFTAVWHPDEPQSTAPPFTSESFNDARFEFSAPLQEDVSAQLPRPEAFSLPPVPDAAKKPPVLLFAPTEEQTAAGVEDGGLPISEPFVEESALALPDTETAEEGKLSLPPLDAFIAANQLPADTVPPPSDEDREADERCLRLENRMRAEFDVLVKQLDNSPHPQVEAEIERLVQRGAGFTWRQKYMFTEFGLILRRKRRGKLALKCHLRALDLAPHDEHVLFNVARMDYELGNAESAKAHLRAAVAAAPGFEAAKNFLDFLSGIA